MVRRYVVESDAYDGFIVCQSIKEVHEAIDCMHNEHPEDMDTGNLLNVYVKDFTEEEYEKIMKTEWQP